MQDYVMQGLKEPVKAKCNCARHYKLSNAFVSIFLTSMNQLLHQTHNQVDLINLIECAHVKYGV